MDIDSFRDGEQFSTFDTHNFLDHYPDDSTGLDTLHNFHQTEMYEWNMDVEREINGDIALIPMCDIPISRLNDSSPNSDEFQRIINDWQQFISPDLAEEFRIEEPIISPEENEEEMIKQIESPLNDFLNINDVESFDLTSYIAADESTSSANPIESTSSMNLIQSASSANLIRSTSSTNIRQIAPSANPIQTSPFTNSFSKPVVKKIKAPVKKIDLKAQRYIVDDDEDEVDVETVSENEENGDCSAVLEACDVNSLLEQFEATVPLNIIENGPSLFDMPNIRIEPDDMLIHNNFSTDGTATPGILKVEQMDDIKVKVEPEPIGVGKTVSSKPYLPKVEEKCNIVVKTEAGQIYNEKPVLPKVDVKNIKKEYEDFKYVKVKDEPTSGKKKVKSKIRVNRENIKTENDAVIQPKPCKVKVEPFDFIPEIKPRKVEKVKQTRIHVDTKQNTEKQINPAHSNSERTLKNGFISPTPNKTSTPKQLSPPQQCGAQRSIHKSPESTTSPTRMDTAENKHIIDSLPQELIARIKESGKRKPISVIPPIPPKRRGGPRTQETSQAARHKANKNSGGAESVQLDHDYCGSASSYAKQPKIESSLDSADEDDRPVIGKQPTVKNADGKLMVSLLKVNTIHSKESSQKKKLNLEEYKKRREGFLKSNNNSHNCSPISSASNSPLPEDENTRRIRHQEKLMKMAMEVLNTPPKPEKKPELPVLVTPAPPIKIPVDMEKKTLVSIGVNTDFKVRHKSIDPFAYVERLEEVKPILKKASGVISYNSFLTAAIENVPKLISSCDQQDSKTDNQQNKLEHGEDKTIVYLPKSRAATKTRSIECQTNVSLIQQTKASRYRRRRTSSSSSCSSLSSDKSRKSRTSSRYSRRRNSNSSRSSSRSSRSSHSSSSHSSSSSYSSRSSNRSRSRSPSPRHSRKTKERLREVEERRVIYVGRISPGTSRDDLRKRFHKFGPITNISLHSRDHGYLDNYGFVTFANKLDAYEAIEHGNDDPWQPKYDLSFGGRRIFCQTTYSDLDNMRDESGHFAQRGTEDSFDALLRDVQEKLRKRKV